MDVVVVVCLLERRRKFFFFSSSRRKLSVNIYISYPLLFSVTGEEETTTFPYISLSPDFHQGEDYLSQREKKHGMHVHTYGSCSDLVAILQKMRLTGFGRVERQVYYS